MVALANSLFLAPFAFLLKFRPQKPFFRMRIRKTHEPGSAVTVNLDHGGGSWAVGELVDVAKPELHCALSRVQRFVIRARQASRKRAAPEDAGSRTRKRNLGAGASGRARHELNPSC